MVKRKHRYIVKRYEHERRKDVAVFAFWWVGMNDIACIRLDDSISSPSRRTCRGRIVINYGSITSIDESIGIRCMARRRVFCSSGCKLHSAFVTDGVGYFPRICHGDTRRILFDAKISLRRWFVLKALSGHGLELNGHNRTLDEILTVPTILSQMLLMMIRTI
mmetsp:Transcript_31876/g.63491  ORF Transcript_31876/g.63491 Transcript_31876/m.63491 type:complete len:163 (+) Transcript_31876:346-834(+)